MQLQLPLAAAPPLPAHGRGPAQYHYSSTKTLHGTMTTSSSSVHDDDNAAANEPVADVHLTDVIVEGDAEPRVSPDDTDDGTAILHQLLPSEVRMVASRSRSRGPSAAATTPLDRNDSGQSISLASHSPTAALERKRSQSGRPGKPPTDERTGFARIYFENQSFTSSTVFKLTATTTVHEVRQSMANKIKIPGAEFGYYVIVVVYPSDTNSRSLSGRTLQDDELMLPLVEKLNRARSSPPESDEVTSSMRQKAKHRSRPPLKFVLKDVRGAPLDLEEEFTRKETIESSGGLVCPPLLGKGVRSGYMQKASVKDSNVWRKRWFVVKDDQLLYCKSATNQRDVTAISLLSAYLAKARPEVKVPFSFELRTPRRTYQLCANSKDDMVAWIHALHIQIGISSENHRLYEAEMIITEDAVTRTEEEEAALSPLSQPSLLQRVLAREDLLKAFSDFAYNIGAQQLLDTWIECELFRRNCIERENYVPSASTRPNTKRTAKDEWEHLKTIVRATEALPMINPNEVAQLRQSFQSEQLSRRLSIALHSQSESTTEYPRVELIASVHQKIFEAIEMGPFKQFLMQRGYRVLLERVMGRIV